MNDAQDPGEKPEPTTDPEPDPAPGGPADMIRDEDGHPPATPDQPRSAQVEESSVPDEIEEPEDVDKDVDEGEKGIDEATDEPA